MKKAVMYDNIFFLAIMGGPSKKPKSVTPTNVQKPAPNEPIENKEDEKLPATTGEDTTQATQVKPSTNVDVKGKYVGLFTAFISDFY